MSTVPFYFDMFFGPNFLPFWKTIFKPIFAVPFFFCFAFDRLFSFFDQFKLPYKFDAEIIIRW